MNLHKCKGCDLDERKRWFWESCGETPLCWIPQIWPLVCVSCRHWKSLSSCSWELILTFFWIFSSWFKSASFLTVLVLSLWLICLSMTIFKAVKCIHAENWLDFLLVGLGPLIYSILVTVWTFLSKWHFVLSPNLLQGLFKSYCFPLSIGNFRKKGGKNQLSHKTF